MRRHFCFQAMSTAYSDCGKVLEESWAFFYSGEFLEKRILSWFEFGICKRRQKVLGISEICRFFLSLIRWACYYLTYISSQHFISALLNRTSKLQYDPLIIYEKYSFSLATYFSIKNKVSTARHNYHDN